MYDDELNFKTGLPLFGLGILSIPDAARLLVIDMWNNGDVDSKKLPHIESECQNDLIAQTFSSEIAKWQDTIISGISSGSLCTVRITKDFRDNIVPHSTYIDDEVFFEWVQSRGYHYGDHIKTSYRADRNIIVNVLREESLLLRRIASQGSECLDEYISSRSLSSDDKVNNEADKSFPHLKNMLASLIIENRNLKSELQGIAGAAKCVSSQSIHPRTKNTMLKVIAILCKLSEIDYSQRGAASKLRAAGERIGINIDDETIKKFLDEIPNAL